MSRRARRVDKNQSEVVEQLRQLGYSVELTYMIGDGFPDFIVGFDGFTVLVELKSKGGKLTEDEIKFHDRYKGCVITAFSLEDIIYAINQYKNTISKFSFITPF